MLRPRARIVVSALAVSALLLVSPAHAGTVIITTNTTISDGDTSIDNQDVIVRGATLTINGQHALTSLTVERNESNVPGVVTHTPGFSNGTVNGFWLIVENDVFIQGTEGKLFGSAININGAGFGPGSGPGAGGSAGGASGGGGAGHGGAGGNGFNTASGVGGGTYGSFIEPQTFGSGGGTGGGFNGAAGGGAARFTVGGTFTLEGLILANGLSTVSGSGGGGAGGSVWIDAVSLQGDGLISANGGSGNSSGGEGGGGRIAVYTNSVILIDANAFGGLGDRNGAAGTYHRTNPFKGFDLFIDNNDHPFVQAVTEMSGSVAVPGSMWIRNGARVGPPVGDASLHLHVTGLLVVEVDGAITADGRGHAHGQGPGAGGSAGGASGGGGAGHGGAGANGSNLANGIGGSTYGSFTEPIDLGSGGGTGGGADGAAGGGVIRISVDYELINQGSISANGASTTFGSGGGGAGGSIWIDTQLLSGPGLITANGAPGNSVGGEGAGGRVAVYSQAEGIPAVPDTNIRAYGGTGERTGSAGTVVYQPTAGATPALIIDNGNQPFVQAITEMSGDVTVDGDLLVRNNGHLGPPTGDASLHLTVLGDATVEANGTIEANGRGHAPGQGPGAGGSAGGAAGGGGAGHGGAGANGSNTANGTGGSAYGSFEQPTTLGSGGGSGGGPAGGAGGGVLRITVNGNLTVDGEIAANGTSQVSGSGGGGAGGSVWIDCESLAGAGLITANGAPGNSVGGEGAGGRVAVYANASTFDDLNIRAHGGAGDRTGGAGTVFYRTSTKATPTLIIDNGDQTFVQAITEMAGQVTVDGNLLVRNGGHLGAPSQNFTLELTVQGSATIAADGLIDANGRGYQPGSGPGAGISVGAAAGGGGAGHGGAGGNGSNVSGLGGLTYGSFAQPVDLGSGGGSGGGLNGGAGGGGIRLIVSETLIVEGQIAANGSSQVSGSGGGGSGGSVWIDCDLLMGAGLITANGAPGNSVGGEGGGGRVAVYANSSFFDDLNIRAWGGAGDRTGGAGTVYYRPSSAAPETLIIDNGDQPLVQARTEMTGDVTVPENLLVRNQGHLGAPAGHGGWHLTVLGNALIDADGAIDVVGRGYGSAQGFGAGGSVGGAAGGGGAGHGGMGGNGSNINGVGGVTYGSDIQPIDMGSGGGSGGGVNGGAGGGAVRLTVAGGLTVEGAINANGSTQTSGSGGGGSGGSVWITAGGLTGTGFISANGGTGNSTGGEGGGGRIAIYSCALEMNPANITVNTGAGAHPGQPGTIVLSANSIDILEHPEDRDIEQGESTEFNVVAVGQDLTYQWRRDTLPITDDAHYNGAQTDTLTLTNAICDEHEGDYDVAVTDACGTVFTIPAYLSIRSRADINGDCVVNVDDLLAVINAWGTCPSPPAACHADVAPAPDGNGVVNVDDLLLVINSWG